MARRCSKVCHLLINNSMRTIPATHERRDQCDLLHSLWPCLHEAVRSINLKMLSEWQNAIIYTGQRGNVKSLVSEKSWDKGAGQFCLGANIWPLRVLHSCVHVKSAMRRPTGDAWIKALIEALEQHVTAALAYARKKSSLNCSFVTGSCTRLDDGHAATTPPPSLSH